MQKFFKIFFLILIVLNLLILNANLVLANGDNTPNDGPGFPYSLIVPLTKGKVTSLADYIRMIFNFAVMIVGIIAVLVIILGGYLYITAAGNATQIEKAKGMIFNAIIGLVLVLLSVMILRFIGGEPLVNFPENVVNIDTQP